MLKNKKILRNILIPFFIFVLAIGTLGILTNIYLPTQNPANANNGYDAFDTSSTNKFVDFSSETDIKVLHMTDLHYYPTRLLFNGDASSPNFTEYKNAIISTPYLGLEAVATFRAALKNAKTDILEQKTDFMLVSGDLTKNAERLGNIDVANALRKLQNDVRQANPNFQIFVTPGNHDFYNAAAVDWRTGSKVATDTITRKEFSQIYASLGYPDITEAEAKDIYSTSELEIGINLPYVTDGISSFVNSTTSPIVNYQYQFEGDINAVSDIGMGELTYIARFNEPRLKDYTIISIDDNLSNETDKHVVAGTISAATHDFLLKLTGLKDKTNISVTHHNLLPHFTYEDSLTKDFTLKNYAFWRDLFSDIGIRYNFSGHMHSADIAYDYSFNNEIIYDFETPTLFGATSAYRIATIERGSTLVENSSLEKSNSVFTAIKEAKASNMSTIEGKVPIYAENVRTTVITNKNVDFTYEIKNNYIPQYYIDANNLNSFFKNYNYVTGELDKNEPYLVENIGEYAHTKHYLNIVDNVINTYLTPAFIENLIKVEIPKLLGGIDNAMLSGISPYASQLVDNLLYHIDNVVLSKYKYKGTNPNFIDGKNKTLAFVNELIESLLKMEVAPATIKGEQALRLDDFLLDVYQLHSIGTDVCSSKKLGSQYNVALNNLKNGKIINEMLDKLLDSNSGLLRIIDGLLKSPIDMSRGFSANQISSLTSILGLFGVTDLSNLHLDALLTKLVPLLPIEIPFDTSKGIAALLDNVLEDYLTTSLYTGLGNIAYDIAYSFAIDPSYDGQLNEEFRINFVDSLAYINEKTEVATVANGKLPNMITNNFGVNPQTTRNFTYFTSPKVEDSAILYSETLGGNYILVDGKSESICTTTPSIDLGIFATTMTTEIRRHTIEVSGLKPDTTYYYKLGSKKFNYFSPTYTFKTGKEDGAFNALLMTDVQGFSQGTYDAVKKSMDLINEKFSYDLVLAGGDMVDNSQNLRQFGYLFNTLSETFANKPLVVAAGNHEVHTYTHDSDYQKLYNSNSEPYNYLLSHFNYNLPTQNPTADKGFYYSFDYSNVHFTVLNTNDSVKGLKQTQLDWLNMDLAATSKKFKVVLMHKGIYTSGSHSYDKEVIYLRDQLSNVFLTNNVNLVLQGHDHTYNETYFLYKDGHTEKADRSNKRIQLQEDATMYVTLGTLGDKVYNYKPNSLIPEDFGKDKHAPTLTYPTFGFLEFDGTNLYYSGYEVKNNKIVSIYDYNFLGLIIYSLTIIVSGIIILCIIRDKKEKIRKKKLAQFIQNDKARFYPPKPKW